MSFDVQVDDFTRSNESPLSQGGAWQTTLASSGRLQLLSNKCKALDTNGWAAWGNGEILGGLFFPHDVYATIDTPPGTNTNEYVHVGWIGSGSFGAPGSTTGYAVRWNPKTATDRIDIVKIDAIDSSGAPTETALAGVDLDVSAGDSLGLRQNGTTLTAYRKPSGGSWTSLVSTTDSTYTGLTDAHWPSLGIVGSNTLVSAFGANGHFQAPFGGYPPHTLVDNSTDYSSIIADSGVYTVSSPLPLFRFLIRSASQPNAMYYYKVDDSTGTVNSVAPARGATYLAAVAVRAVQMWASSNNTTEDDYAPTELVAGDKIAFMLVTDTLANLLANNSTNSSAGSPLAFFSVLAANPDGSTTQRRHHFSYTKVGSSLFPNAPQYAFEDRVYESTDLDFNDFAFVVLTQSAGVYLPRTLVGETARNQ